VRLIARQWPRADRILAVSENTKSDIVQHANVPASNVEVVYSAIQEMPLQNDGCNPDATRYILHVAGNNTHYKNRQGVVEIYRHVSKSEPVRLIMAGAPPDAALTAAVAQAGIGDRVTFKTDLADSELFLLYCHAACLLFPSRYEGFGWPPLEAMRAGCPVVCSNAGSLPEIVGDAALLASPDDHETMANQVVQVLRDTALQASLVDAGRQQCANFTLNRMGETLASIYHGVKCNE
jgi:glycosyltransferase involved in cell wall biosynthesis